MRAWIETSAKTLSDQQLAVARRVRAWIETCKFQKGCHSLVSHAVCVRGLKHYSVIKTFDVTMSHAVCVRGLKQKYADYINYLIKVARRVRAWIETINKSYNILGQSVARRVRAWIETTSSFLLDAMITSRTPCACVD